MNGIEVQPSIRWISRSNLEDVFTTLYYVIAVISSQPLPCLLRSRHLRAPIGDQKANAQTQDAQRHKRTPAVLVAQSSMEINAQERREGVGRRQQAVHGGRLCSHLNTPPPPTARIEQSGKPMRGVWMQARREAGQLGCG